MTGLPPTQSTRGTRGTLGTSRSLGWLAVVVAVWGAGLAPARADAAADLAKFAGSYQYAGRDEEGIAIIDKAIAEAVAQMNKVKGLVVKKVLEANKRFIKNVTIDLPSGRVHIKLDDLDIDVKPGEAKDIGNGAKLTVRMKGSKLEQLITSDRGTLTTLYEMAEGGQVLHRDVSVTDKWLDNPVRYRLTYKRR